MISYPMTATRVVTAICLLSLSGCVVKSNLVDSIRIVEYGIIEYAQARTEADPMSPVGATVTQATGIRISERTSRIPLKEGVSYGIRFLVSGKNEGELARVTVVLRSSQPCLLKTNGQVVYHNDSTVDVEVGVTKIIGGRLVSEKESHCAGPIQPGTRTFELYHEGKKLAEKSFDIVIEPK